MNGLDKKIMVKRPFSFAMYRLGLILVFFAALLFLVLLFHCLFIVLRDCGLHHCVKLYNVSVVIFCTVVLLL